MLKKKGSSSYKVILCKLLGFSYSSLFAKVAFRTAESWSAVLKLLARCEIGEAAFFWPVLAGFGYGDQRQG